jgi:hypothetical protein
MDEWWNPRFFLISGICNAVLSVFLIILVFVMLALGGAALAQTMAFYGFFSFCFMSLGSLAIWQYRAMRVLDVKLQDLYSRLPAQQQPAK